MDHKRFPTKTKCVKCSREVEGHITIDLNTLKIADSNGFMVFAEGTVCDICVDEPRSDVDIRI